MNGRTLLLVVGAVLSLGCAEYDAADVDVIEPDREAREARHVSVGGAATVKVKPQGRTEYSGTEAVSVRSETPGLATAERTLLSDSWTILGHAPGQATFKVYVNEELIDTFRFTVIAFEGGAL